MELITFKQRSGKGYMHKEVRASRLFPILAYDEEKKIFINDQEDQSSGFGFLCEPLKGSDGQLQERLSSFLNTDFPPGTIVSVMWIRSPDIMRQVADMELMRTYAPYSSPLLRDVIAQRGAFLKKGTLRPLDSSVGNLVVNLQVVITVKIPIKGAWPTNEEEYQIASFQKKTRANLETVGMAPVTMDDDMLLRVLSSVLNWGEEASWRQGVVKSEDDKPLSDQVLDYDTDIVADNGFVKLGDTFVKVLSAKRLPESMYFGDAIRYVGDLRGGNVSIKQNYAIVCNIYYPDAEGAKHSMERSRAMALNQAKGPMLAFVPILGEKKQGFDSLYESVNDGNRIVKMTYSMILFGKNEDEVTEAAVHARSYWREQRFTMMEDRFIQLPMLINCLPMMADRDAVRDLWRYKTLTAEQAAVLIPIFGEWKGTGTPHVNLVSRNGQLMNFSMHDTGTNKNMLICATSGGGKSFFTNELILSYMSEGAQVWVIDVGRSYEKLCSSVNGDFVHFGPSSDISVNPFPLVVSLDGQDNTRSKMLSPEEIQAIDSGEERDDGEEDALVGLVSSMATISSPLDDFQLSTLRKIVTDTWKAKDRDMLVDDIAEKCAEHSDQRINDLAVRLQAFTSTGSYGRYFSRPNNVDFNNQLTVLELEELKGRQQLQKVVLFQLIYQIQQAVYLGARDRKKLVIIDEAWDLLANGGPEIQKFIEHAYRRFRKYGASVLLVTQSIQDMYKTPVGEAIVENSATMGLFRHNEETVDKLKREDKLTLPEGGYYLLKTVHTIQGRYSEIFLKTERGMGVGRLFVNEFQKLLYSTNAEDVHAIQQKQEMGMSVEDAIRAVIQDRQRGMHYEVA